MKFELNKKYVFYSDYSGFEYASPQTYKGVQISNIYNAYKHDIVEFLGSHSRWGYLYRFKIIKGHEEGAIVLRKTMTPIKVPLMEYKYKTKYRNRKELSINNLKEFLSNYYDLYYVPIGKMFEYGGTVMSDFAFELHFSTFEKEWWNYEYLGDHVFESDLIIKELQKDVRSYFSKRYDIKQCFEVDVWGSKVYKLEEIINKKNEK